MPKKIAASMAAVALLSALTIGLTGCGTIYGNTAQTDAAPTSSQATSNTSNLPDSTQGLLTSKAQLTKIDIKTKPGRAALNAQVDKNLKNLDKALNNLDKSMGSI